MWIQNQENGNTTQKRFYPWFSELNSRFGSIQLLLARTSLTAPIYDHPQGPCEIANFEPQRYEKLTKPATPTTQKHGNGDNGNGTCSFWRLRPSCFGLLPDEYRAQALLLVREGSTDPICFTSAISANLQVSTQNYNVRYLLVIPLYLEGK